MTNVIKLNNFTKLDIKPSDMLRAIADEEPDNVFLVVWTKDGSMPSYHSSTGDTPVILMRIQEFVHKYYNGDFHG